MGNSELENSSSATGQLSRLLFSAPGLAMLVAVASLVVGSFGFRLARPSSETQVQSDGSDLLRFESRIWQDPVQFLTAEKLRGAKLQSFTDAVAQNWQKLARDFFAGTVPGQTNAVMFVIGHPSPFPQGVELRLRARVAVLAALRASGLVKKGADETRFISLCDLAALSALPDAQPPADLKLIPGEVFNRDRSLPQSNRRYERVMVLWLPERAVKQHPWDLMEFLVHELVQCQTNSPASATNLQIGVVGPRSSDGLQAWFSKDELAYARTHPPAYPEVNNYFSNLQIVSPWARAPDAFYNFGTNSPTIRARQGAEAKLRAVFPACGFNQFGSTDDRLCFTLAAELSLRGVDVTRDKILLLSEYDTFYGRSLPMTFRSVVATLRDKNDEFHFAQKPLKLMQAVLSTNYPEYAAVLLSAFKTNLANLQTNDAAAASNVFCFSYLAGLDGSKTVADNAKDKADAAKPGQAGDDAVDLPYGEQQLDYTKRLANSLNQKMASVLDGLAANGSRIKAVGLLGSDIFDKMLMLQALRSRLPDCIFFTTELDARFTMPSQTEWTRNLVTASGFDLIPPNSEEGFGFAPFRDGYQTAGYEACLSFLTAATNIPAEDLATYEIGRTVQHRLAVQPTNLLVSAFNSFSDAIDTSSKANILSSAWQELRRRISGLMASPAFVFGISIFFLFGLVVTTVFRAGAGKRSHWFRVALRMFGVFVVILLLLPLIFWDGLEPMMIGDGVSALPSAMLLLMALVIGIYGLWRTDQEDQKNSVSHLFNFWLCLLSISGLVFLTVWPGDYPVRAINKWPLQLTMTFVWVVSGCLCVATAFFWRSFLKQIEELIAQAERLELRPTAESFFQIIDEADKIAREVERIGPLSYFPMATILLLVLANSAWLDDWHFSSGIILLLTLKVVILVALPVLVNQRARFLKRVLAQQIAGERLQSLQLENAETKATENRAAALDLLNRGCFAPLSQQPVLGALASLLGGSGLITLLEQMLAG